MSKLGPVEKKSNGFNRTSVHAMRPHYVLGRPRQYRGNLRHQEAALMHARSLSLSTVLTLYRH